MQNSNVATVAQPTVKTNGGPSEADMLRLEIAALKAQLAVKSTGTLVIRQSKEKPTVCSVYGLGKFPVSLHGTQWQRLIEFIPQVQAFLKANPTVMVDSREK